MPPRGRERTARAPRLAHRGVRRINRLERPEITAVHRPERPYEKEDDAPLART